MSRRAVYLASFLLCAALLLSGCGLFDSTYRFESDCAAPQSIQEPEGTVLVRNLSGIKSELITLINQGSTSGTLRIDSSYSGDLSNDLATACWQVRTENAFCSYCVESISYETYKALGYSEARIVVSYSRSEEEIAAIHRLGYSYEVGNAVLSALENAQPRLVLLIDHSNYTAEDMRQLVLSSYAEHPLCLPSAPAAACSLYSGAGNQRLYEITLAYHATEEELEDFRRTVSDFAPFSEEELAKPDKTENMYSAYRYLIENCNYTEDYSPSSAACALLDGRANSEGLAMAFKELCSRFEIPCIVVHGQKNWSSHCWNIVQLYGEHYHVDVSAALSEEEEICLVDDQRLWESYRWDMSSYPSCGKK